jgi:hypothetical protein
MAMNENKWAKSLDYHHQSTEDALELFRMLRLTTFKLIKTVPEHIWLTATVQHSESESMTFDKWLQTYEDHIPVHIRQMERTYNLWKSDTIGVE